ncbi:MAG: hypothetical protein M1827_005162 [Pycnora praestabilis]|nr:MAG: hypothetical protein M1827_005162 [Pycnora praestabilis]
MADDFGDQDAKGRPQSTIARSFSAALNDAFNIDGEPTGGVSLESKEPDLSGLSQSVQQKKQAVTSQSQELEAIEARLRATEHRLKNKQHAAPNPNHPHKEAPLSQTFSESSGASTNAQNSSTNRSANYSAPAMPGAMPQTPGEDRQNYEEESERRGASDQDRRSYPSKSYQIGGGNPPWTPQTD